MVAVMGTIIAGKAVPLAALKSLKCVCVMKETRHSTDVVSQPTITHATWTEPILTYTNMFDSAEEYYTANASFPLNMRRHRDFSIDLVDGVNVRVIVSRSEDEQAYLVVESVWAGSDLDANVELASGKWFDQLSVNVCTV